MCFCFGGSLGLEEKVVGVGGGDVSEV